MSASLYVCIEPGCTKGRDSGHALYRTSAKGELFEGRCEEHFEGVPDPVTQAIEQRNLGVRPTLDEEHDTYTAPDLT